ncbi:hypothetical protein RRG08_008225 [Elysia crispata]|uniref:Uncharacterized protein n=1 Tax=Elysia crispata TaxID=231223 RepID=A0AAE0YB76_9GAST|nr:hypothetical protein RRG08_008225 [Elysia crispata]
MTEDIIPLCQLLMEARSSKIIPTINREAALKHLKLMTGAGVLPRDQQTTSDATVKNNQCLCNVGRPGRPVENFEISIFRLNNTKECINRKLAVTSRYAEPMVLTSVTVTFIPTSLAVSVGDMKWSSLFNCPETVTPQKVLRRNE